MSDPRDDSRDDRSDHLVRIGGGDTAYIFGGSGSRPSGARPWTVADEIQNDPPRASDD